MGCIVQMVVVVGDVRVVDRQPSDNDDIVDSCGDGPEVTRVGTGQKAYQQ